MSAKSHKSPSVHDSRIQWKDATSKNGSVFSIGVLEADDDAVGRVSAKKDFGVTVDWPVDDKVHTTDTAFQQKTGIAQYEVQNFKGTTYAYRIGFRNTETYDYRFWDEEGDSYRVNTFQKRWYYVRYNSKKPKIIYITGS